MNTSEIDVLYQIFGLQMYGHTRLWCFFKLNIWATNVWTCQTWWGFFIDEDIWTYQTFIEHE
jgi:hypothetical protein